MAAPGSAAPEHIAEGLRSLLELPVELVLPTSKAAPADPPPLRCT